MNWRELWHRAVWWPPKDKEWKAMAQMYAALFIFLYIFSWIGG